jgi:uncharacterized SAM-binding protein YcdF (DUF218 family)
VIRRALSLLVVVWFFGFVWFAIALPRPLEGVKTDAIVVPTGGWGRIPRGLALLDGGAAGKMLVTGVDREVKPREFAAAYRAPDALMDCCIVLGFSALDTRGNARETARWVAENRVRSIRLVTSDWHMRRAARELATTLPADIRLVRDAVRTEPSLWILFLEYHKLLATSIAQALPQ